MFGSIWDHFVNAQNRCKSGQTYAINAKVCATKSRRNFKTGVFCNVWVHLAPFRYCVKLAANRAELVQLMQMFVQQNCVRIFPNEGT